MDGAEHATWTLGAYLGSGGFGIVYGAADAPDQVIKIGNAESLQTEASTLQRLSSVCSDMVGFSFPRLVSALQSTRDDTCIALRLSPRGMPLPHYIDACDQYRSAFTPLARRVGVEIVSTLRHVHAANIAHGDICCHNVLLLPQPDDLARIISAAGVFGPMREAVRAIDIARCRILLSDWGCATFLMSSNRPALPQKDLKMVVDMIHQFGRDVYASVTQELGSECRVPPEETAEIPSEQLSKLMEAVDRCDYDGLVAHLAIIDIT